MDCEYNWLDCEYKWLESEEVAIKRELSGERESFQHNFDGRELFWALSKYTVSR